MLTAIASLAVISLILGLILGVAARYLAVEGDSRVEAIIGVLPGANCGQCGFPGCAGAAEAMVSGTAAPTCCPPGGKVVAQSIADCLGVTLDESALDSGRPLVATIDEKLCIGCTKCGRLCPSDAIIGANKQLHGILDQACTACNQCIEKCPTSAIGLVEVPETIGTWVMPKPVIIPVEVRPS